MENSIPVAIRYFRLHRNTAIVCLSVLFIINYFFSGSGWYFWLALVWIMVVVIHYCIVRSIYVDEDWAYDRAQEMRMKSYDLKHINAIRSRYIRPRRANKNTEP